MTTKYNVLAGQNAQNWVGQEYLWFTRAKKWTGHYCRTARHSIIYLNPTCTHTFISNPVPTHVSTNPNPVQVMACPAQYILLPMEPAYVRYWTGCLQSSLYL